MNTRVVFIKVATEQCPSILLPRLYPLTTSIESHFENTLVYQEKLQFQIIPCIVLIAYRDSHSYIY